MVASLTQTILIYPLTEFGSNCQACSWVFLLLWCIK